MPEKPGFKEKFAEEGGKIIEFPRNPKLSPEEQKEIEKELLAVNRQIFDLEEELAIMNDVLKQTRERKLDEEPAVAEWKKILSSTFKRRKKPDETTKATRQDITHGKVLIQVELKKLNNRKQELEKQLGPEAMAEINEMFAKIRTIRRDVGHFIPEKSSEHIDTESGEDIGAEKMDAGFDLEKVYNGSLEFYKSHHLHEFIDNLPPQIILPEKAKVRIKEALAQGFDQAIIIPGLETQKAVGIARLKEEMADKPLPGLSDNDQYTDSYLNSRIMETSPSIPASTQTKRQKPYILLYQSTPIPQETKNLTYLQADALFQEKNRDGLTLAEYYLLQRKEAEKNKNHSFDAYNDNPEQSNWSWLLDARISAGCVYAAWRPKRPQVEVGWGDLDGRGRELGARPIFIVEL